MGKPRLEARGRQAAGSRLSPRCLAGLPQGRCTRVGPEPQRPGRGGGASLLGPLRTPPGWPRGCTQLSCPRGSGPARGLRDRGPQSQAHPSAQASKPHSLTGDPQTSTGTGHVPAPHPALREGPAEPGLPTGRDFDRPVVWAPAWDNVSTRGRRTRARPAAGPLVSHRMGCLALGCLPDPTLPCPAATSGQLPSCLSSAHGRGLLWEAASQGPGEPNQAAFPASPALPAVRARAGQGRGVGRLPGSRPPAPGAHQGLRPQPPGPRPSQRLPSGSAAALDASQAMFMGEHSGRAACAARRPRHWAQGQPDVPRPSHVTQATWAGVQAAQPSETVRPSLTPSGQQWCPGVTMQA